MNVRLTTLSQTIAALEQAITENQGTRKFDIVIENCLMEDRSLKKADIFIPAKKIALIEIRGNCHSNVLDIIVGCAADMRLRYSNEDTIEGFKTRFMSYDQAGKEEIQPTDATVLMIADIFMAIIGIQYFV